MKFAMEEFALREMVLEIPSPPVQGESECNKRGGRVRVRGQTEILFFSP